MALTSDAGDLASASAEWASESSAQNLTLVSDFHPHAPGTQAPQIRHSEAAMQHSVCTPEEKSVL